MDSGRRLLVVALLLFVLVVCSNGVAASRSLKTVGQADLFGHVHHLDVIRSNNYNALPQIKGRMTIELQDYPGTGANDNHDPYPGRKH